MSFKKTLLYLLILGIIGGAYYYFEVYKASKDTSAKEKANKIFDVKREDIQKISLKSATHHVVMEKKDGAWQIISPVHAEANEGAIRDLLDKIDNLSKQKDVGKETDLTTFGLASPEFELEVGTKKDSYTLRIGQETPTAGSRYASVSTKPGVFLLPAAKMTELDKDIFVLREKKLLTMDFEEVDEIQIKKAGMDVDLKKDKGTWQLSSDKTVQLKSSKIDSFARRLCWIEADSFPGKAAIDLNKPDITITLLSKGKAQSLKFWDRLSTIGYVYAQSSLKDEVVEVSKNLLEDFPKGLKDFKDRTFLTIDKYAVEKIAWKEQGKEKIFTKKEDGWFVDGKKIEDPWVMDSLFLTLRTLEYDEVYKALPKELSVAKSFTFYGAGEKVLLDLTFYSGDYLKTGTGSYRMLKEDVESIDGALQEALSAIKEKKK